MYSRGLPFLCENMTMAKGKNVCTVFSHHRRRRAHQLCDVSLSLTHSLALSLPRPPPTFYRSFTPPPKLFTPSPPKGTSHPLASIPAQSSPPSKCFLCMELFVLLLGVGVFAFFPPPATSRPWELAIKAPVVDGWNVVDRKMINKSRISLDEVRTRRRGKQRERKASPAAAHRADRYAGEFPMARVMKRQSCDRLKPWLTDGDSKAERRKIRSPIIMGKGCSYNNLVS